MRKKLITISALAKERGISRQRIFQFVKKGIIPINKKKLIDADQARKILDDRKQLDHDLPMSKTLADARIKSESMRAEMLELEFKKKRGELIEREKVIEICTGIIMISKTKLLSIPTKVAPLVIGIESIKKIKSIIDKEIRIVLTELSRMDKI